MFRVGEVAVVKNVVGVCSWINGAEVEVVSICKSYWVITPSGDYADVVGHRCREPDGGIYVYAPFNLKKKPPDSRTTEWADTKLLELIGSLKISNVELIPEEMT